MYNAVHRGKRMRSESRREFLKQLGTAAAFVLATRGAGALAESDEKRAFEFLVVGDSIIWGQGLAEKDKFCSLTADWLRKEVFAGRRDVDLKMKAHSGSTLRFHKDEAEKYKKAGRDESYSYDPELTVSFPSIWKQIEVAAQEYRAAGNAKGADLIMLSGGINDITISKVLDPFGDNRKLPGVIEKYCGDGLVDVLDHAAEIHPNALIAVVGYFPMLSPKTSGSQLMNVLLEKNGFPRFAKPVANNAVVRLFFFDKLRKKGIVRSRIWIDESNKNQQVAVDRLNAKYGRHRAIFIKSPITEDTCFGTPNTLVFRMNKNGSLEDPLYRERVAVCYETLPALKAATHIDYSRHLCEIATAGHPNAAGSRAYAEVIKSAIMPVLR